MMIRRLASARLLSLTRHFSSQVRLPRELKISVIGAGKMSQAICKGLIQAKAVDPTQVTVSDRNANKLQALKSELGVLTSTSNSECTKKCDVVLVAIKPQGLPQLIQEIQHHNMHDVHLMSILAGVSCQTYLDNIVSLRKVTRVMPNTPAVINRGMSTWFPVNCTDEDNLVTRTLLQAIGEEMQVAEEDYIDMATALSGTGPAYLFMLLESMIDAGVHMGFPRDKATVLVQQTMLGAAEYSIHSKKHPSRLRNDITSPGGTTANALYQLEKQGFRTAMTDAIFSAYNRSKELRELSKAIKVQKAPSDLSAEIDSDGHEKKS